MTLKGLISTYCLQTIDLLITSLSYLVIEAVTPKILAGSYGTAILAVLAMGK